MLEHILAWWEEFKGYNSTTIKTVSSRHSEQMFGLMNTVFKKKLNHFLNIWRFCRKIWILDKASKWFPGLQATVFTK